MADKTVNLFGSQVKRGYVIAGAVVLGAAVIYGWYKNKQAASAAPAATSPTVSTAGDAYPPDGTTGNPSDPYSTDPATGMTYGDEAGGGYVGNGVSNLGGYYGNSALYGSGTGYEEPGSFTSNAYWTQYCEQEMGSSGDDAISAALGGYITGAPLTTTQISIVEQAIAIAGYPPVAGANGYPPSIQTGPSGSGGATTTTPPPATGTTGTTGTTPPPASQQPPPAKTTSPPAKAAPKPPAAPSSVEVTRATSSSLEAHWTNMPGAHTYKVQVTYQSQTVRNETVSRPAVVIDGLTPDHTYGIHVSSVGDGGTSQPAATWAKTTK